MFHPRARLMIKMALPALIIGVLSSLMLIGMMGIAAQLQHILWQSLPGLFAVRPDSPAWIIGTLTLTGIAVGLIVRFMPGHGGPDPATESLVGMPLAINALPGLGLALIVGLAGGVSLGPENPITAINIALTLIIGQRLMPKTANQEWVILAASATIGAMFGSPVAAALIFSQQLGGTEETPFWDRLFAPLIAAGTGALTTQQFFLPDFSLSLHFQHTPRFTDVLMGSGVALCACAIGMVVVYLLPHCHALFQRLRHPVLMLGCGGFILGCLGVLGGPVTLFKGLDEMRQLLHLPGNSASALFGITLVKLAALLIAASCGFRGGRIFPAVFAGVSLGLALSAAFPALSPAVAISCAILGLVLVVTRDGWLSLFMAAAVAHSPVLLPLLCLVLLPAWWCLAGRPLMLVNKPSPAARSESRL
ncbi:ion channel protein [Enterobacillus tribolii]|uniref:H+/Cl-antiporter ClcA n=1 Tax=Enterobacillus tribolii TaxID=1487935 RepID=A0A370QRQ3_9GAMM|nr:ion channel protein [Enterobacillus tribolii]MBW7983564.1 ion channel protein [Enterobacillus tribolii]RDK91938.1 H+/Cl- antiporter ClcA [Enterobacillus tribolii]